jgi:selenocysteine lyase/cysteine desulfurase
VLNDGGDAASDDAWFRDWRCRELARVDQSGVAYLDYTGAALYPASLVRADADRLLASVLGNPHSEHAASRASSDGLLAARRALLDFVAASPDEYEIILTPNTTGACRLVGESFPFTAGSAFLLAADNHNSVNGIREFARERGAHVGIVPLDEDLRLVEPLAALEHPRSGPSLFAYPAQSNFSGVRHPLALVDDAQRRGWRVLVDAASFLPTSDLRLGEVKPDFVTLSLYKIAGYPTGIGALIARRDALTELRRPWFSGGTVQWASVQHQRHRLIDGPEGFEDGTPPFLAAAAVAPALGAVRAADRPRLRRHLLHLTELLLNGVASLRHGNGAAAVQVHGPLDAIARGATVAVSLRDQSGQSIPYWDVERAARGHGIAVRGGCFCNPGCAEAAFAFPDARVRSCLDSLGRDFTIPRFAACLDDRTVGAIRVSMGLGTIRADVERLLAFLRCYTEADHHRLPVRTLQRVVKRSR